MISANVSSIPPISGSLIARRFKVGEDMYALLGVPR